MCLLKMQKPEESARVYRFKLIRRKGFVYFTEFQLLNGYYLCEFIQQRNHKSNNLKMIRIHRLGDTIAFRKNTSSQMILLVIVGPIKMEISIVKAATEA